jgi:hypothetical protein
VPLTFEFVTLNMRAFEESFLGTSVGDPRRAAVRKVFDVSAMPRMGRKETVDR